MLDGAHHLNSKEQPISPKIWVSEINPTFPPPGASLEAMWGARACADRFIFAASLELTGRFPEIGSVPISEPSFDTILLIPLQRSRNAIGARGHAPVMILRCLSNRARRDRPIERIRRMEPLIATARTDGPRHWTVPEISTHEVNAVIATKRAR
jgi:hypothetical protein